jgi:hypothetical protein
MLQKLYDVPKEKLTVVEAVDDAIDELLRQYNVVLQPPQRKTSAKRR